MGSPRDIPVMTLPGWSSRRLSGTTWVGRLVTFALWSCVLAPSLQTVLQYKFSIQVPYMAIMAIFLGLWFPLTWNFRWPMMFDNASGVWHLHLSAKGFAASIIGRDLDWQPWLPGIRVSFRRVKTDLCRIRICQKLPVQTADSVDVDLVVACEDEMVDLVNAFIVDCQRGRESQAPCAEPLWAASVCADWPPRTAAFYRMLSRVLLLPDRPAGQEQVSRVWFRERLL